MIGGLGICGRPFCCSQFLDGFLPVSIKMAKTQNLSLNPTKISGTCGRLMCCLKYEQNAYEDAAKRMPKVESFVQTPDGPGNVKSVDLLRETMKVALDSAAPNEPLKCYHNCEVCVLRNGKGSRDGIAIPGAARPVCGGEGGRGDLRYADPGHPLLYGLQAGGRPCPGEDGPGERRRQAPPQAPGRPPKPEQDRRREPHPSSRPPRPRPSLRRRKRARSPARPRPRRPSSRLPLSPRGRRPGQPLRAARAEARPSAAGPGTGAAAAGTRAARGRSPEPPQSE